MRLPRFITYRNPQYGKCPSCKKSNVLHRSRPKNMFEQIIKQLTFYRLVRCNECGWRGFLSALLFTKESLKAAAFYLSVILLTAYIVKYILTKFAS